MTTTTLPLDGERLLQIARDTGLRHHLHGVAPEAARELLSKFSVAVWAASIANVADAIDGAIAFGASGVNPPPAGHWLQRFWDIGRDQGSVTDQSAARNLAFAILMQVADEAPINGNELAQARVIFAAYRLRDCAAAADSARVQWNPMTTAPRNGTVVRLLVEFDEGNIHDDNQPQATIGTNTFDDSEIDEWQFAGWSWCHDCWTQGTGKPIGWLPFHNPIEEAKESSNG